MALCQYCGKVEIAWHQVDRRWVACEAQRDTNGAILRKSERSGTRTVTRPVPDPARRHYPHAAWGQVDVTGAAVSRAASECPKWTPELAAGRKGQKRGGWRPRTVVRTEPTPVEAAAPVPAPVPAVSIGVAAAIGMWSTQDAEVVTEATAPCVPDDAPRRVKEPEELMEAADLAAWARAEAIVRCPIIPTRVILWGPPGTGKTELPWRIAKELGWEHVYQLMTEETPGTELLGHLVVQAGSTVWADGTLGRAIRASHRGHVVYVVDEIARASQDAMSACLLALTNPESLRLTLRSGEVLEPKPEHWHVVACANDDPAQLPPALADRLHMSVRLLAPHPGLVRSMMTAEARVLATAKAREYSVRALLTYDRLRAGGMSLADAAGMVWEPEAAQSFRDAAALEGGYANATVAPRKTWNPCRHTPQTCPKCGGACCGATVNSDIGCYACGIKVQSPRELSHWNCDANPNYWGRR
jgi:hypothetical protein